MKLTRINPTTFTGSIAAYINGKYTATIDSKPNGDLLATIILTRYQYDMIELLIVLMSTIRVTITNNIQNETII